MPDEMLHDEDIRNMSGYLPGTLAQGTIETDVDPIQGHDDGNGTGKGLHLERHPRYILRDEPELWEMVERFNLGEFNSGEGWCLNQQQVNTYSSFETEIVSTISSVLIRKRIASMPKPKGGNNNDNDITIVQPAR